MNQKIFLPAILLLLLAMPVRAAVFDHAAHQANPDTKSCSTCHVHEAKEIKPEAKVCNECHDQDHYNQTIFPGLKTHGLTWALEHRQAAKANNPECAACHEQHFCIECHKVGPADQMGSLNNSMTNVHRSDFQITHPLAARTNPQRCASCHETKYCSECHDNFRNAGLASDLSVLSHRKGWSNLAVGGATHANFTEDMCQSCHTNSVLPAHEWSSSHAREARKNLTTCQACHPEGDVCMKCHSALSGLKVNPHPKDWEGMKNRISKASDGRTCRRCH